MRSNLIGYLPVLNFLLVESLPFGSMIFPSNLQKNVKIGMFDDTRGCQPTFHRIFHRIWPFYPHCTGMFGEFFHMFFPLKLHNLWISFICFIVFPIFLVDFPIDFFHDPHLFPISRWTTPNPPLDDPSELGLQLFHMRLHQSSGLAQS